MKTDSVSLGVVRAKCYALTDKNGVGAIIDPGDYCFRLSYLLQQSGIKELKYIIFTHGHFDHINGASRLKEQFPESQILVGEGDEVMLSNAELSGASFFNQEFFPCYADRVLKHGDIIEIGDFSLKVIGAPGHSPGGIVLYNEAESVAFTGDTLFKGSIGRTDLYGGDALTLVRTLKGLKSLPEATVIYPGHGEESTVGYELKYNYYMA